MQYVGLIGYPLGHSLSAAFQQAAFDALGIEMRYLVWETPPDQLPATVAALRDSDRIGANVTIPHKVAVIPLVDRLSPAAARIGAMNTIVREDGELVGYNTDAPGFVRSLRDDAGFDPEGKRVLLLGAGGAARAVAFGLLEAGVSAIVLSNRSPERATHLAEALVAVRDDEGSGTEGSAGVQVAPWNPATLEFLLGSSDVVVNCTSMGMVHSAAEGQSPLHGITLSSHPLYCDLVYNPEQTPFLQAAAAAGAKTLGGLPMLIYQGAEAFHLWTGVVPPVDVMCAAARQRLYGG